MKFQPQHIKCFSFQMQICRWKEDKMEQPPHQLALSSCNGIRDGIFPSVNLGLPLVWILYIRSFFLFFFFLSKSQILSGKASAVHREIRYFKILMCLLGIQEIRRTTKLVPEIPLFFRLRPVTYLQVDIFIQLKRKDQTSLYLSIYSYYRPWATTFFQSIIRKRGSPANFLYVL